MTKQVDQKAMQPIPFFFCLLSAIVGIKFSGCDHLYKSIRYDSWTLIVDSLFIFRKTFFQNLDHRKKRLS